MDRNTRGQGPRTQAQVLSKKKVFTKIFQAISKKKVFTKIFQAISTKNVFQRMFQALHKILTIQKMVLSSSRPIFEDLRPRGQGLQNVSSRTSSRTPPLTVSLLIFGTSFLWCQRCILAFKIKLKLKIKKINVVGASSTKSPRIMYKILNWTKSRIGQNPERTKSRIGQNPGSDKVPNGKNPKQTKSRTKKFRFEQNPELDIIPIPNQCCCWLLSINGNTFTCE